MKPVGFSTNEAVKHHQLLGTRMQTDRPYSLDMATTLLSLHRVYNIDGLL